MTWGIPFRRNTMLGDDWLVGVEGVGLVAKQAYLVANCLSEDHGAHERNLSRLLRVDLRHRQRRRVSDRLEMLKRTQKAGSR